MPRPQAETVARRAAMLAAVMARGVIDADESISDGEAVIASDLAYFDELDLARDAEPQELEVVRATYGTLSDQATIDATWRVEGLAVLAWALGRLDALPPIDTPVDHAVLHERLGLPWSSADDVVVVRSPELTRAPDEIDALSKMLLTAHWRVREFTEISRQPVDFVALVPEVEWAELSLDGLEIAERDLAIGGEPIAEADLDRVRLTGSILTERRLAVSWLQGYDELYSEGDINT